jgi:DNA recombination protein RmuC
MSDGPAIPWLVLLALLLVGCVAALLVLALRAARARTLLEVERTLRDGLQHQAQAARSDLAALQQALLAHDAELARTHNEQLDTLRSQLLQGQHQVASALRRSSEVLADQLQRLGDGNDRRQAELRQAVEQRLLALQDGNERRLEQMRAAVDERLQATLEQRLGESFRLVAERLEQVHRGLGDMQALARDVGSLSRVLTNVKTRGVFGEVQLAALLEQVLVPGQYAAHVETVPGSGARVEFALRLPGRGDGQDEVWLPIDAKFPREDHDRLLDAQERADAPAVEAAARSLEQRMRLEARTIREKYVAVPHTTDFAILFVPTESLYAEVLRRPGLAEALQRDHRVVLAGPTTLLATLNSLQMGFRTLALERRSAEVWEILGSVKTEFRKFGDVLARTRRKLEEASSTLEDAQTRTRAMERRLRAVEAAPQAAEASLPQPPASAEGPGGRDD